MASVTKSESEHPLRRILSNLSETSDTCSEISDAESVLAAFSLPCVDENSSLFEGGTIPEEHRFSWQSLNREPKSDHGTTMKRTYKNFFWRTQHTGGFLRLFTIRGYTYWLQQITFEHLTPDWKIHFSVRLEDIPCAWNIVAGLFMEMDFEFGMKATTAGEEGSVWPQGQWGREITVYIFKHDSRYDRDSRLQDDPTYRLGLEHERFNQTDTFWFDFISAAETRLAVAGVISNGISSGEYPLPNCKFASLRNESFVQDLGTVDTISTVRKGTETRTAEITSVKRVPGWVGVYPPNYFGFNGANHDNPMRPTIVLLSDRKVKSDVDE